MAEQKREKEERKRENLPKDRNFEVEQVGAKGGWGMGGGEGLAEAARDTPRIFV